MANHKSAEKRNRQRTARTTQVRGVRTRVRGVIRQARQAIAEASDDAAELVQQATRLLDRAASKRALPVKRTARVKSRLVRQLRRAASASKD